MKNKKSPNNYTVSNQNQTALLNTTHFAVMRTIYIAYIIPNCIRLGNLFKWTHKMQTRSTHNANEYDSNEFCSKKLSALSESKTHRQIISATDNHKWLNLFPKNDFMLSNTMLWNNSPNRLSITDFTDRLHQGSKNSMTQKTDLLLYNTISPV